MCKIMHARYFRVLNIVNSDWLIDRIMTILFFHRRKKQRQNSSLGDIELKNENGKIYKTDI